MSPLPSTVNAVAVSGPFGVLLVDDQQAVRDGLSRLIACSPRTLRCLGAVATGQQALLAARQLHPDVVVVDVDLNGEDGLALLPQLLTQSRVLVLTCHDDNATRDRALRLGAQAFLAKHLPAAELLGTLVRLGGLGRPGAALLSAFAAQEQAAEGASTGPAVHDKTPPRQGSSSPRGMAPSSAARRDRDA
jgi:DNA-binding NarL/FixJ family response regulator